MFRRLAPCAAALALLAAPALAESGADDGIDTEALVNDAAMVSIVFFEPDTVHGIADAFEEGDDKKRIMLEMAAATQGRVHAPGDPFKVRLVERIREIDISEGSGRTAIWRVCRYPDRDCPVRSLVILDETAYLAERPDDFAEE